MSSADIHTELAQMVERWRLVAGTGRRDATSEVLHKCADELERALRRNEETER